MNYQNKTKEVLIKELQKLQQKHGSLKSSYEKEISGRKQAEEALLEPGILNKELMDMARDVIFSLTPKGLFGSMNQALEKITGWQTQEWIGKPFTDLLHPEDIPLAAERFSNVLKGHTAQAIELRVRKKSGDYACTEVLASPRMKKGMITGLLGIARDITERKQAEEALHLEKENFRHSLDDSPLGVRIASIEGNTIYANKTILNFYGYDSLGELQKTPLKNRYTPESYVQAQERKHQRERGDLSATDYEISIVRKNGEIRHLQVFRKEVLWDGVRQFQVIYEDITERKQAEEEIRKSKKLLEDLHKHLTEIRENERALISREIHDELGQSMTALKLDLNRMNKYLSTNPEAMMKLKSMIELVSNTIKDVQRISSDLRPGILDELGLVSAIEWYCDEFEKRTGIKCNLKLDNSDFSDSQITLTFFRVLQETLTNVIRHAKASSVKVKLKQSIKGTTLTVQDNGIGITKEQIKSNKSLGLVSMHERVRQFNGTIDIFSEKGDGTKLTIFIPS